MTRRDSDNLVSLNGPLTLAHAEAMHALLTAGLRREGDLVLACEPDAEVDVAFVQLLVATQRSAAAQGKRVSFLTAPAEPLAAALRCCGFESPPGAVALASVLSISKETHA